MKHVDLSIGQRLAIGFGTTLVLIAVLVAFSWEQFQQTVSLERRLTEVIAPRTEAAGAVQTAYLNQAIAVRTYALTDAAQEVEAYRQAWEDGRQALEKLEHLPRDPEGESLFQQIRPLAQGYDHAVEQFLALARTRVPSQTLRSAELELTELRRALAQRIQGYVEIQRRQRSAARAGIVAAQMQMLQALWVLGALVLVSGLAVSIAAARSVRDPTLRLVQIARAMERGDYAPALALNRLLTRRKEHEPALPQERPRDELMELNAAVARMAGALEQRERRLTANARLSSALAASIEDARLAEEALRQMVEYSGSACGAAYALDGEGGTLRRAATYALGGAAPTLQLGEGVPGQAALEGRTLVVNDIPQDTPFHVRFGFEDVPPRTVAAVPIRFREAPLGVILLGSLREISQEALEFVEDGSRLLGVSLQNALAHRELGLLAEELRQKNERLAAQNEELHAQAEEIQAQSEEMEAQNEELHAQAEQIGAHNQELEEADARKNQFLAMLAHELRNPLAAIAHALAVLRKSRPGQPSWSRSLEIVERQARHQTRLVDDLLDVSRITRGKIELHPRRIDLVQLVTETAEDWRPRFQQANLALILKLPDEALPITGDPERLSQVLANLLNNALKFTPAGGEVTLEVAAERAAGQVRVTVSDSGIGIDPRDLPHVFEAFTQVESSLDRSQGGLGLGLALVKSLVSLHGGEIHVHSEGPGRGAAFTVCLPLRSETSALPGDPRPSPPPAHPLRVLLVDDNGDAAVSLQELLEAAGHTVRVALSGPDGVAAAQEFQPDVVLCDIGLPGMDGYAVARALRQGSEAGPLALIALTGYGGEEDRRRALAAGFDRHIVKPVEFEALQQVLAETAARGRGASVPAPAEAPLSQPEVTAQAADVTVLVVEDEADVRDSLAGVLEEEGYYVTTAANGAAALEYLRGNPPPDLIVLDLMMPGMNGWAFRTEQLQDPDLSHIPVVVLTGSGDAHPQATFLDAADYLAKPVDLQALLASVARVGRA